MEDLALFAGRWHPLLVHLPIGMLIMALLLEVLARKERYAAFRPAVPAILLAGSIAAVFSCISGYFLFLDGGYDENILSTHKWLGIAVAVISLAAWGLRQFPGLPAYLQRLQLPLLFLVVLVLSAAGHFGGSLTHGTGYLSQGLPPSLRSLFGVPEAAAAELPVIPDVQEAVVFHDVIRPILAQRCISCHRPGKTKGGLRLDSYEMVMKGGEDGNVLTAGEPSESELYRRLTLPEDHDDHMPPEGRSQPSPEQISLIHWWIASGAPRDKKVKELAQPDSIQPLLLALESGQMPGQNAFLPEGPVEAASPDSIRALAGRGVKVMPVARESSFLRISCMNDTTFGNKDASLLLPLSKQIVWARLGNTRIGDEGLAVIGRLVNLTRLHLDHTEISDEGLAALVTCEKLRFLNLFDTRVSDAGLQYLQQLPSLTEVHLYKTDVSPEGIRKLQEARPELRIDTGNYVLPLLAADTTNYSK